jgi:hypothetical protein
MPAPRLIIDAEGGSRFTPSRKVYWDVMREAPPTFDGTWDTAVVAATSFEIIDRVYQWLISGKHQFASVGHDHLTEIQERIIAHFNGTQALREADWGTLLRQMKDYVRKHRDLVFIPDNTVQCVIFASATEMRGERQIPMMSGSIRGQIPYFTDLIGYMYTEQDEAGLQRKLLINPIPPFEAGDRTHRLSEHYGPIITNPSIIEMLTVLEQQEVGIG